VEMSMLGLFTIKATSAGLPSGVPAYIFTA
jgi:hypothetical protein